MKQLNIIALATASIFIVAAILGAAESQSAWGKRDAKLTVGEFLQLYFQVNLVSHNGVVFFDPNDSADKSIVVITQGFPDEGVPQQQLREAVRNNADAELALFKSLCIQPEVKNRWNLTNPVGQIIIRYVRLNDQRETIAVTSNGETGFDADAIGRAEAVVKQSGGFWYK